MASHGHDALWAKLWELELQLAAYKLLHAARWGDEEDAVDGARETAGTGACCRGRQYDAYVRRRDARRVSVSVAAAQVEVRQPRPSGITRGRPAPLTVKCAARDTPQVRRPLPVATTPRKERGPLARSRTVSAGAAPRPQPHQRRNSAGGDLGGCATPRPFLRRGSGTGGATGVHLRSPRVHDLPIGSPSPRRPQPQDQLTTKPTAGRHLRSVSEVPFHAAAAAGLESPRWAETPAPAQARARKRWGSLESPPPAIFSAPAANPHMDLAKGIRKLLSFVRKSKSSERQHGGGDGGRESGDGKPVKGWGEATACSGLDGRLDRACLEGHRFPMTRAVGTSG